MVVRYNFGQVEPFVPEYASPAWNSILIEAEIAPYRVANGGLK